MNDAFVKEMEAGNGIEESLIDTQDIPRIPFKSIFLRTSMIIGLAMCWFSGFLWRGLDPILEPELRKAVDQES